jgi:hypothetical protein
MRLRASTVSSGCPVRFERSAKSFGYGQLPTRHVLHVR